MTLLIMIQASRQAAGVEAAPSARILTFSAVA
jgi:hypothetical protein